MQRRAHTSQDCQQHLCQHLKNVSTHILVLSPSQFPSLLVTSFKESIDQLNDINSFIKLFVCGVVGGTAQHQKGIWCLKEI
jgi:hypothetical protein